MPPSAVGLGQYGVVPNYFEQNQAEALDLNLTVLDTLIKWVPPAGVFPGACPPECVWHGG